MGSNHANGVTGLPGGANGKGDDGTGIASEVVFAAGLKGRVPRVSFLRYTPSGNVEALWVGGGCFLP